MVSINIEKTLCINIDDFYIKIINMGGCVGEEPTFISITYGPTEGGLNIDNIDVMTVNMVKNMLTEIEKINHNLDLINKFNNFLIETH